MRDTYCTSHSDSSTNITRITKNYVAWVDIPLNPSFVPICGSEPVLAGGSIYGGGKGRVVTLNWNWETRDFTAARPSGAFQLNKKLFNVFHKSDQTCPSLIIPSNAGNTVLCHVMPGQLRTQDPNSKNNEEDLLKSRHEHGACLLC